MDRVKMDVKANLFSSDFKQFFTLKLKLKLCKNGPINKLLKIQAKMTK